MATHWTQSAGSPRPNLPFPDPEDTPPPRAFLGDSAAA